MKLKNRIPYRMLSILFCLVLLAGEALAVTITGYTLEEKFRNQMVSSGFRGSISFTADGDSFSGLNDAGWKTVASILEGTVLEFSSTIRSVYSKDRETAVDILRNGETIGSFRTVLENGMIAFSTDLLNEYGMWYEFSEETDALSLILRPESGWPDMPGVLFRISNASKDWKERAERAASPYLTKLAIWLQNYQEITVEGTGSESRLHMHCEIPSQDVITQMKQMMVDFYLDGELLSLLGEVLTAQESAAYLMPAVRTELNAMLDRLEINGSVQIDRTYDANGNILTDRISLPFAEGRRMSYLAVTLMSSAGEEGFSVNGAWRGNEEDYEFSLEMLKSDENTYTGTVTAAYPQEEDGFDVRSEERGGLLAADLVYSFEKDEETYLASQDLCEKSTKAVLLIRPREEDTSGIGTVSASFVMSMQSKSRKTAATKISAALTLADQDTGSTIGAEMTASTAERWQPISLSDLEKTPMRLDTVDRQVLDTVKQQWLKRLTQWFGQSLAVGQR